LGKAAVFSRGGEGGNLKKPFLFGGRVAPWGGRKAPSVTWSEGEKKSPSAGKKGNHDPVYVCTGGPKNRFRDRSRCGVGGEDGSVSQEPTPEERAFNKELAETLRQEGNSAREGGRGPGMGGTKKRHLTGRGMPRTSGLPEPPANIPWWSRKKEKRKVWRSPPAVQRRGRGGELFGFTSKQKTRRSPPRQKRPRPKTGGSRGDEKRESERVPLGKEGGGVHENTRIQPSGKSRKTAQQLARRKGRWRARCGKGGGGVMIVGEVHNIISPSGGGKESKGHVGLWKQKNK